MTTFLLVPGAGGRTSCSSRVVPLLEPGGQRAVAADLPAGDESAGWGEDLDVALDADGGDEHPAVVVDQSMGGFTVPVAHAPPVSAVVLLNAMVPRAGECGGDRWGATGQPAAAAEALEGGESPQPSTPFTQPWPGKAWPDAATRVLAGRDDRLFPQTFQRRVAWERLGLDVEVLPGGHLAALSRP